MTGRDLLDTIAANKKVDAKQKRQAIERITAARRARGLSSDDVVPGFETRTWDAQARMAHARRAAGFRPDELDGEALRRYPDMPGLLS